MEYALTMLKLLFLGGCCLHCYTDMKDMVLYDSVSLVMLVAGGLYNYLLQGWQFTLLGASITGGSFLLLYLLFPKGIGLGDVELAFVLGCWLGWQKGLLCLLVALWLGFLVGIGLLVLRWKNAKEAIPFGPYLCLSGVLFLFIGESLLAWYKGLF